MKRILEQVSHRPWPAPRGLWVMAQSWRDLLFAHWRVQPETLRAFLPDGLQLDLYEGEAWLGVVPFRMAGVRFHGCPPIPGTASFPELNVRTYVRCNDKPGVWFFSLDAANALAVIAARAWFHLPYFHAHMRCGEQSGSIEYVSFRTHHLAAPAEFKAVYRGVGPEFHPQAGSLQHFLTERYCLFTQDARGRVLVGEIHHPPWTLQTAEAQFTSNTMANPLGLILGSPDLLHFSKRQDVFVWAPKRAESKGDQADERELSVQ